MNKKIFLLLPLAATLMQCKPQSETDWLKRGVDRAVVQLEAAAAMFEADTIFPRSYKEGRYKLVGPHDWTSGFFPGSLWLGYELTGDTLLKRYAQTYTAKLHDIRLYKGTHDLGFMIFCSYGNQFANLGDEASKQVIMDASESLSSRVNDTIGLIRSWDFGEWNYPVIIDNMMNLEMLFRASKYSGDPKYRDIAVRHADITLENHFREDNSSYHVISYNDDGSVELKGTFQGFSDESAWARGQAWGLYGYTMSYRETGMVRYLEQARRIAAFIMNHPAMPEDLVPYWDFNAPDIPDAPRDASAAAVISSALFDLSTLTEGAESKNYFDYATRILKSLSGDGYLAAEGDNGSFVLMHCVGHLPAESEVDTPLNYADYYYLEAAKRYLDITKRKL